MLDKLLNQVSLTVMQILQKYTNNKELKNQVISMKGDAGNPWWR